jgi:hypothetical protein
MAEISFSHQKIKPSDNKKKLALAGHCIVPIISGAPPSFFLPPSASFYIIISSPSLQNSFYNSSFFSQRASFSHHPFHPFVQAFLSFQHSVL